MAIQSPLDLMARLAFSFNFNSLQTKLIGQVPPPTANQNANPNAGAAIAPKRPNENSMGGGPPNKAPTPSAAVFTLD